MNATYIAEIVEQKAQKGETESAKKGREQYNKMLKESRKTELAPVSEPLFLNCELLFALADELDISESEKTKIDQMLHTKGDALFLVYPLDSLFRFDNLPETVDADDIEISFNGREFVIPTKYVSDDTSISVKVAGGKEFKTFTHWRVTKVERKAKGDLDTFLVTYQCDETQYSGGEAVTITVTPKVGSNAEVYTFTYKTEKILHGFLGDELGEAYHGFAMRGTVMKDRRAFSALILSLKLS